MTLQLNIFGQVYDDSEPCFIPTEDGVNVFSRVDKRLLNLADLEKKAEKSGHVWQNNEIGLPSEQWQKNNWNGQKYASPVVDEPVETPVEKKTEKSTKKVAKKPESDNEGD